MDSIKAINHTINLTLSKYNLGPIDEENCKVFVGDGYKKLVERALIHCGDCDLKNYEDALSTYTDYFKIHCMYNVKAYDGIKDLLNYLKNKNIKISVLSNKPHERTIENVEGIFGSEYLLIVFRESIAHNRIVFVYAKQDTNRWIVAFIHTM